MGVLVCRWVQVGIIIIIIPRYFFSLSFSICDNQDLFSSDESPGHTIPIRS